MKLWDKNTSSSSLILDFTIGKDRIFDRALAPYDVLGSMAHVRMLGSVGLLTADESINLEKELKNIYARVILDDFAIPDEAEDIHSYVEFLLTEKLGDTGKKIHSARSRNDQVLVDIKLFLRDQVQKLAESTFILFGTLQAQSEKYKQHLMPGYTHLQLAMPSSFGLWFGAYAESLVDDMIILRAAYDVINKNPLGSAAGYGSSFPINRKMTTELLGFDDLNYNVVYAQMTRGKSERMVAMALANIAETISRLSMDATLYLNQNFAFIEFPEELTTGSSIMPHKKNPDSFELIRALSNRIKSLPNEIMMITTNLPSGYHRDLQILKQHLFPAIDDLANSIMVLNHILSQVQIRKDLLNDEKYKYLFSVEEVNKLVIQGMPFRDAYKKVGMDIEAGNFKADSSKLAHTHEGSIGNLCTEEIRANMAKVIGSFPFEQVKTSIGKLFQH